VCTNEANIWLLTYFTLSTVDLVEVCHPNNCNVGLLAYSPLAGGVLTGKYLDANADTTNRSRLNLFPGYMARYNASLAKV
jgi:aryl-alcohol dehydrogenase-like predicted oxidoreductase